MLFRKSLRCQIVALAAGIVLGVAGAEGPGAAPPLRSFTPGSAWLDTAGQPINAHGGGLLYEAGTYYWFGEKRGRRASLGVNVYSSTDLYNWRFETLALAPVTNEPGHDLAFGCVLERPKVLHNGKTGQYVMWFHLELKGEGYNAARAGVAVSDRVTGPYRFVHSFRPHDHMARDMTLFRDDDGRAYQFYASRDNYDLRVCQLSDDFLRPGERDMVITSDHREAPAVFKRQGTYFLITSACTGWRPNAANYYTASRLFGPWTAHPNPMRGPQAETTFDAQSTFVLALPGRPQDLIFLADRWNPRNLAESRYVWLPIRFPNGQLQIEWQNEWRLADLEDAPKAK